MHKSRRSAVPGQGADAAPVFDQRREPGPLLRRCHQRSQDLYAEITGTDAPTRQQLALMIAIQQLPEATQARISARTGVDRNTIAGVVRRLEERGLIERRPSVTDSRASELRLTEAGRQLVEDLMPRVRRIQDEILRPLPQDLRPVFIHCLRLIAGVED